MRASFCAALAHFEAHLKLRDTARTAGPPVHVYVLGAREWRSLEAWPPPARPVLYYLHAGGLLAPHPPAEHTPPAHFVYDPADPTPEIGGTMLGPHAGQRDNRPLEARPDVLSYTSAPLAADLEVIGPVRLDLYVASTVPHADFLGRLCDVAPDGRSLKLCDGLVRVRPGSPALLAPTTQPAVPPRRSEDPQWGASSAEEGARGIPAPLPDGSLHLSIDLWATANRFRAGHRLRLQVAGGAHPRWSRNLGTGEPLATGTAICASRRTVYHDKAHPSALVLPVVSSMA
jgi:putative CocE/NonD family hydrolase